MYTGSNGETTWASVGPRQSAGFFQPLGSNPPPRGWSRSSLLPFREHGQEDRMCLLPLELPETSAWQTGRHGGRRGEGGNPGSSLSQGPLPLSTGDGGWLSFWGESRKLRRRAASRYLGLRVSVWLDFSDVVCVDTEFRSLRAGKDLGSSGSLSRFQGAFTGGKTSSVGHAGQLCPGLTLEAFCVSERSPR